MDEVQRAVEVYGMKGIGELEIIADYPIDIPQWIPVLKNAADLKVPVLVHAVPGSCARAAGSILFHTEKRPRDPRLMDSDLAGFTGILYTWRRQLK